MMPELKNTWYMIGQPNLNHSYGHDQCTTLIVIYEIIDNAALVIWSNKLPTINPVNLSTPWNYYGFTYDVLTKEQVEEYL